MAKTGRPPKYNTPEEMQAAIDAYFEDTKDRVPGMAGLAYALGFRSRRALLNYEDKDEFLLTIKKARMRVEAAVEDELLNRKGQVTGLIFNLKENFGWKDAQEITHVTEENGERKPLGFVWPNHG